jgi:trimeric autotransporter adhesin
MIIAYYPGDATFAASDSSAVSVTVTPEGSNTTVNAITVDSGGHPIPFTTGPYGTFVYLSADVAGKSGFGVPTGMVNFLDNASFIFSSPLNSKGNGNTPNGIFNLAPGSHAVTATYGGDVSFNQSTSAAINFTVVKGSTSTSVQTGGAKFASGAAIPLTAIIDTTSHGNAPSGSVNFFSGSTQLPGTAFVSSGVNATTGFAQGTATMQVVLPDGTDSITAQYLSDTNYSGSTSSAVSVTIAPDFSLAFTGNGGSVMNIAAPGGSGTLTLTVTGGNGYNGTVNFTKCTGLPLYSTCSFNPASVTGSGSTTLTVSTTAAHSSLKQSSPVMWAAGITGFPIAGLFFLGALRRKHALVALLAFLVFAVALASVGCGGSNSGGGSGTLGTTPGTYIVTATGADANFNHPAQFTVTVK